MDREGKKVREKKNISKCNKTKGEKLKERKTREKKSSEGRSGPSERRKDYLVQSDSALDSWMEQQNHRRRKKL